MTEQPKDDTPDREKTSSDHDEPYEFGNSKSRLSPREQARLMISKAKHERDVNRQRRDK